MAPPRPALPTSGALRGALAVLGAIGALCLIASTFATIIRIQVGTTSKVPDFDTHLSGWDRHGPALLLLGLFALAMAAGALRGARPAAVALAAVGVVSLVLIAITDVPNLHKVGFIGKLYEDAVAGPQAGFYLETAGCVLLIAAGGALLMLGAPAPRPERPRRRPRVRPRPAAEPRPPADEGPG
ncbi:MAG: hypothetical protein ACXVFN_21955 [Solirubrobacteraceae bacterium]